MENRYCLQMVSCDGCGGASNVYSTEEAVCGTWIDGKPIYRKVISGTLEEQNGIGLVFANVSDLKIERVINIYGNLVDNQGVAHVMLQTSYNRTDGLFAAANMFYDSNTQQIRYHFFNNKGLYSGSTAYVILEYTKQ